MTSEIPDEVRTVKAGTSIVAIHVDDTAAAASTMAEKKATQRSSIIDHLGRVFEVGEVCWLLGIGGTRV
jgi:20S proteasome alpha/beta subunit